jgi:hypothetical protein
MRIRLGVSEGLNRDETAAVLDSALEAVTRSNVPQLLRGMIPSFDKALRAGKVRWRPEPPGDEHFDDPKTVLKRGWGDCDDLAPWHAASLRASGVDPEATAVVRPSGPNRWHAVVERHDGRIEDPSKAAGMGSVGGDEYRGPFWPAMLRDRMTLATTPHRGAHYTRADVPWSNDPDLAWSVIQRAATPLASVRGAVGHMLRTSPAMREDDYYRLAALHDLLSGSSPDDVRVALESHEVGSLFSSLIPAAASLIPGGGLAAAALPLAQGLLKGGGDAGPSSPGAAASREHQGSMPSMHMPSGNAPGTTLFQPGGPIIVRF